MPDQPSLKTILFGFLFGMGFQVGTGLIALLLDLLASAAKGGG